MDSLLAKLEPLSSKRRTTYKKSLEPQEQETTQLVPNSPPAVLGSGFLFQNSTINKVRNRLKTIEDEFDEEGGQKQGVRPVQEEKPLDQTQVIADLYDGAEELERTGEKNTVSGIPLSKKNNPAFQGITQVISEVPSKETIDNNDNRSANIHEDGLHREANDVTDGQVTQHIQSLQNTTEDSVAQTMTDSKKNSQVLEYVATNEINLDTQQQSTQPSFQDFEVTNLDTSKSFLFQPTVPDSSRSFQKLKINEIERELEEKHKKENLKKNTESRKLPEPTISKRVFSKEAFLKNFDEESDSEDELVELNKKNARKRELEKNNNSIGDNTKLYENRSIFKAYEHKLRHELDSKMCIQLDDNDESGEDQDVMSSRASKATVLDIKVRKLQREPLFTAKQKRTTLNDLICTLKKASKKQILNHQKELIERRGYKLEDIEKEKEEVENLLEQEIARNKKISNRERRPSNSECPGEVECSNESASEFMDYDFSDMDYSGNSDSENEQENEVGEDYNGESTETTSQKHLGDRNDSKIAQDKELDEEEEGSIRKGRVKNSKTYFIEDMDPEENKTPPTNAIDLGPYGNNLKTSIKEDSTGSSPYNSEEKNTNDLVMEKIRRMELKRREKKKRIEELKSKGLTKMLEVEAEESEDEWKGVGGLDGEFSDEYDSDLEGMVDDITKSNENSDTTRQLLAKEDKELDEKLVNKILYDIQNGGFRKRGRNTLDLELSDDEDDDLRNYRLKRRELMRKSRLDDKDNETALKNTRSKAFLNSIVDDIDEPANPFGNPDVDIDDDSNLNSQSPNSTTEKTKHTLSQEFVQKSLSFLRDNSSSREFELRDHNMRESEGEDISSLKRNSSIRKLHKASSRIEEGFEKENRDEDITLPEFKPPSLIKSFAGGLDFDNKFQSGKKTVTVSNSYRAVGGSSSSITYFGRMRKLVRPNKKNQLHTKSSRSATKPTMGKLWDSQQNSFET